jgi:hypothetical protein
MIQMLTPEYDFILFDSAPLLAVADANLLELHTDATLLVIRQGASLPDKWPKPSLCSMKSVCSAWRSTASRFNRI